MAQQAKIQVRIRTAIPDDAFAIAEVHEASRRHAYSAIFTDEQMNAMSLAERVGFWRDRILLGRQNDFRVLVAEHEDRLCGFIAVETKRFNNAGEVDRVYVDPSLLRRGIGRALIDSSMDHLRDYGFEKVVLWTFEANHNARAFYEAIAFKRDGAERKYPNVPKEVRYAKAIQPW